MKKPFYKRIWFVLLASLLVLLVLAFIIVKAQLSHFVEQEIRYQLTKNPQRLYSIDFEKFRFHPLKGEILLKNASVAPRQHILDSLKAINLHPNSLAQVSVKDIHLYGIDFKSLLLERIVMIKSVEVDKPEIDLDLFQKIDSSKTDSTIDLKQSLHELSSVLHNSTIEGISIKEGRVSVNHWKHPGEVWLSLQNFNLSISDFKFDSSGSNYPMNLEQLNIKVGEITNNTSPFHSIQIRDVELNNRDSTLQIGEFSYLPKTKKDEFFKAQTFQKPWITVRTKKMKVSGFNLNPLLYDQKIEIEKIKIEEPRIDIHMNKNLPIDFKKKRVFLSRLVRNIPIDVEVGLLELGNGHLAYEQQNPGKNKTGTLTLGNFFASLFHIGNTPTYLKKHPTMELTVQAQLFEKITLRGNVAFDMHSENDAFNLVAKLSSGKMKTFNSMLLPMAGVNIEEGKLNNGHIKLRGNKYRMWGTLELDYKDAKIEFLGKEQTTSFKNQLISFAANTVIRSSNKPNTSGYQVGLMNFEKKPEYSFVSFLWNTIQEGLFDVLIGSHNSPNDIKNIGPKHQTHHMKKQEQVEKKSLRKKAKTKRRNS
ncbi:MAG: hypothetical protein KDC83_09750 [Flavobacteriales bacterium]|nr:hypothetical protein [Flavobacteriales bacterium]